MKKFLGRSFLGIPMTVVIIITVLTMAIGTFAAVNLFTGVVSVTVEEPLVVDNPVDNGGTWVGTSWSVAAASPGDTYTPSIDVTNNGTNTITVNVVVTPDGVFIDPTLTASTGASFDLDPGLTQTIVFTFVASGSCPAGTYDFDISIDR